MESFLNRYRNITVLLLVIFAQLVLLAVQVRNEQDVSMIRVWAVTAVTPFARVIEGLRGGSIGVVRDYILLRDAHVENKRLQAEIDRLKMENHFLKTELSTADRARALALFQSRTPSRTLAATIIGIGAGSNSKVVFVDRGSSSGVRRGMPVVVPDGIVGKVIASYPTASEVLLTTDPDFAAGVVSQKSQARGTLKGQVGSLCKMDYVPLEEKVQPGEWIYTSGDDRIFPKGFPVGIVKVVRNAQPFKEILVEPSGLRHGLEDVLILLEGVHQAIPDTPPAATDLYMAPPLPAPTPDLLSENAPSPAGTTEADKLRRHYEALGAAQKHVYGEGLPGSKPPDFNMKLPAAVPPAAEAARQPPAAGGTAPAQPAAPGAPSTAESKPAAPPPGQQPARPKPAPPIDPL
jgi:rod shape-determining protein MreC